MLLGHDLDDRGNAQHKRRATQSGLDARYGISPATEEWGPSIRQQHPAQGLNEDRTAQVQAKKREALLNANRYLGSDARGKFKRRVSVDQAAFEGQASLDARVYVHRVQPGDTIAGVAIKYHCSQSIFCRANRLWPNDSIQVRTNVFIPVDASGVRGRRLERPPPAREEAEDAPGARSLRTSEVEAQDWDIVHEPEQSTDSKSTHPDLDASGSTSDPSLWVHDGWVQIDGFPDAVEIARLPRRLLGFFPPARRKSHSRSSVTVSASGDHTPFQSPPPDLSDASEPPAQHLGHRLSHSSSQPPHLQVAGSPVASPAALAAAHFVSTLRGPGGVGTLGQSAHGPGPAPDKLNDFLAPHLPNMAPPSSVALLSPSITSLQAQNANVPRRSFESIGSAGSLELLGGKMERWARRMAATGKKTSGGTGSQGDLIELVENWDAGSDVNRAGHVLDEDSERALAERFGVPSGGKVFEQKHSKSS